MELVAGAPVPYRHERHIIDTDTTNLYWLVCLPGMNSTNARQISTTVIFSGLNLQAGN